MWRYVRFFFFFSSRRRHTRLQGDWSSDVCSSDLEDALRAALATPAAYVGLVASRKRAGSVLGYLRDRGASDDDLARVRAPAGLDLGRVEPREIAVAILAELVQLRAVGTFPVVTEEPTFRHEEI